MICAIVLVVHGGVACDAGSGRSAVAIWITYRLAARPHMCLASHGRTVERLPRDGSYACLWTGCWRSCSAPTYSSERHGLAHEEHAQRR